MPSPSPRRTAVPVAVSSLSAGLVDGPPTAGTVVATYRFGLYLDVAGDVLPVVTSDAVPVPTALRLAGRSGSLVWGVAPGDRVVVGLRRVVLSRLDLVAARTWRPARVARASAGGSWSQEVTGAVLGDAVPATGWLADGIRDAVLAQDPLPHVRRLVGRGRGLTPSGDDALAGALLVAQALGSDGRLAAAVRSRLGATTAVSSSLLRAAADGYAARQVVTLADAVVAGDGPTVRAALPPVLDMGHGSGHDLVTGIRAALDVHPGQPSVTSVRSVSAVWAAA